MTTIPDPLPEHALAPEPGWTPLGEWPFPTGKPGRFVAGDDSGLRYRLRYYRDAADPDRLHGKVWFGPGAEGPPLHAHGGSMAALLDEACGMACWMNDTRVVAATLTTHFKRMLPLERVVEVDTRVVSRKQRRVLVEGRLFDGDEVFCTAEGLFMVIGEGMGRVLDRAARERDGHGEHDTFRTP
jgi:hypothetical protein